MKTPTLAIPLCALVAMAVLACTDDQTDGVGDDVNLGEGEGEGSASVFSAQLTGAAERPTPVATTMTGAAELTLVSGGQQLEFTLDVSAGNDITAAHVHLGGASEAGPAIVGLFGPADPAVDRNGALASGTLTDEDLVGPLAGGTIADLVDAMDDGTTYVNVHTSQYPDGAMRGQLQRGALDDDEGVQPAGG